ncbi:SAM-dependent methyltransferase [Glycomyces sp. YM15]|uniref:SAM-dependent methyltransferase n=1 Tax=Glycomyces sp. YM15 TaxID=2800446 RepID=UPI0019630A3E|nr:SAM-dependent methyltransferase [Glycomyces sp. YM15]
MATRKTLLSMAADSWPVAKEELLHHVEDAVEVRRVGEESAVIETAHSTAKDLAVLASRAPLVFPRHLTNVVAEYDHAATGLESVVDFLDTAIREYATSEVALQIWLSGKTAYKFSRHDAWERAAQVLTDRGYQVTRTGSPVAVSICFTPKTAIVGVNRVADSLSSWPGGEVRLSKTPDQVSRAEFKLEELFKAYPIDEGIEPKGTALDYGAAPGGWTRILAERGYRTTAVDPGDLDPRVLKLPGVVHERTTAGNFLRETGDRFDLLVNDMKMSPDRSSRLMVDSARLLKPFGVAVTTLKTGAHHVLEQIDESFAILGAAYDIEFARQLRHNRNELTVVLRRFD